MTHLNNTYDDLVFAHRNKAYGAYQLRRAANDHLLMGLSLGVALVLVCAVAIHTLSAYPKITEKQRETIVCSCDFPAVQLGTTPPSISHRRYKVRKSTIRYAPPVLVKDQDVAPEHYHYVPLRRGKIITKPSKILNSDTLQPIDTLPNLTSDWEDIINPMKNPAFPGGETALTTFLHKYLAFPSTAQNPIGTTVVVRFVVETDGSITQIEIVKDPGGGLAEEAIRVIQMMPCWTPGEVNGVPVRVKFVLPIRIHLH